LKILLRLILYFVLSFVVFALVNGVLFAVLFSRHNINVHQYELLQRAGIIAESLADFIEDAEEEQVVTQGRGMGMGPMRGMMARQQTIINSEAFLRLVEDVAGSDVWVIDSDESEVVFGDRRVGLPLRDLPPAAEYVISPALAGELTYYDNFGSFWDLDITLAAPIILSDGYISGVVLLHSQISVINQVTAAGLVLLLYSMGFGVLASVLVAFVLSKRFTRPINKMKTAALKISDGEFEVKTHVSQNDEIGELANIMDGMASKLDRTSKEREKLETQRREFVANVSHELRTPITVMRGSLEALIDGIVKGEKTAEFHLEMLNECLYLERLVTDLLDLSRLQNVDFVIESEVVYLNDIITDAARLMSKVSDAKDVEISLERAEGDFSFVGDYGRLRQMFIIVLDNAVKFSPQGGKITIEKISNSIP